jgi:hypothetical protein
LKIIQNIREKFAKSFLIKHLQEGERKQKPVNLEYARSVALLYYLPDETIYKKMESILGKFNDMNIKTRVVCYTDLKINPHYFIPKISQDIITAKDINWKYQPQKAFVKDFIETPFDILIDLSLTEHLPLLYLAALSKSGLKVGRYEEDLQMFYDLMIHTGTEETIDSFSEQVIHYLSKINR